MIATQADTAEAPINVPPPKDDNIFAEIRAAEQERDKRLEIVRKIVDAFVGATEGDTGELADWPINHPYELIQLVAPRLSHDLPTVSVTSDQAAREEQSEAVETGTRVWMNATDVDRVLTELSIDFLTGFCAALVAPQPENGYGYVADMPAVYRLSPKQVFWDTRAPCPEQRLFCGYKYTVLKSKLVERATREMEADPNSGWNIPAIQGAKQSQGDYRLRAQDQHGTTRDTVTVYRVWTPDDAEGTPGPEAGFNGNWREYIGNDTDPQGVQIRGAVPAFGPRSGPIEIFGAYPVPDSTFFVSPLGGVWHAMVRANAHAKAVNTASENYKRNLFVQSGSDIAKKLKANPDQYIHEIPDPDKAKIVTAESGGASAQQLEARNDAIGILDRISGITDAMRGNVTGEATATENAVADSAANTRIAFLKRQFQAGVTRILRRVVWYIANDDRVQFPLGEQYAQEHGMGEPWYMGGPEPDELTGMPKPVDDGYDLKIQPMSMERVSEATQQRQAAAVVEIATTIAPLIPSLPFIDWKYVLDQLGSANNMPGLGEKLLLPPAPLPMIQPGMSPGQAPPGTDQNMQAQPPMPGALLAQSLGLRSAA